MSGGASPSAESTPGKKSVFGDAGAQDVTLNLTALMDILSNLLFFLLASFGATIVMTINVSVPVQSAASADKPPADSPQLITLNVHLTKTSLDIGATGNGQSADELATIKKSIPDVDGKPDFSTFANYLLDLKEKYPKSDTMILLPDPGVPYEQLVQVMDAAREKPLDVGGQLHTASLFPTVVVSTVVK